eukprot:gene3745-21237_t
MASSPAEGPRGHSETQTQRRIMEGSATPGPASTARAQASSSGRPPAAILHEPTALQAIDASDSFFRHISGGAADDLVRTLRGAVRSVVWVGDTTPRGSARRAELIVPLAAVGDAVRQDLECLPCASAPDGVPRRSRSRGLAWIPLHWLLAAPFAPVTVGGMTGQCSPYVRQTLLVDKAFLEWARCPWAEAPLPAAPSPAGAAGAHVDGQVGAGATDTAGVWIFPTCSDRVPPVPERPAREVVFSAMDRDALAGALV